MIDINSFSMGGNKMFIMKVKKKMEFILHLMILSTQKFFLISFKKGAGDNFMLNTIITKELN